MLYQLEDLLNSVSLPRKHDNANLDKRMRER